MEDKTVIKYLALITLLMFVGCTSSYRLVAVFESADAVSNPMSLLSGAAVPQNSEAPKPTTPSPVNEDDSEDSVLDTLRNSLP